MSTDWTDSSSFSVEELVAQTANQFISEQLLPGFYYYEEYGAYYSPESGYFYDQNSGLFFHPDSQCYYRFNEQTNEYELVKEEEAASSADVIAKWTKRNFKKRATNLFGKTFVQNAAQEDVDVVEITLDLVDKCSFLAGDYCSRKQMKRAMAQQTAEEEIDGIDIKRTNFNNNDNSNFPDCYSSSDEDDDGGRVHMEQEIARRMAEEESAKNAPCIRLVQIKPKCFLHIVTILGANAGFDPSHDIQLERHQTEAVESDSSDLPVFSIAYSADGNTTEEADNEKGTYQLEVLDPEHPCFLNGKQIGLNTKSALSHEDSIQIGEISFLVHIHSGMNTCQGCEPGLFVQPKSLDDKAKVKKRSKHAERLRQMRMLKEQYGITADNDADQMDELNDKYFDRAKLRRKVVGTENRMDRKRNAAGGIYTGCAAAPVPGCSIETVQLKSGAAKTRNDPLESDNKGFQLLKGMGWKEGQGLGKDNQGNHEPIGTTLKNDRAGLGMATTQSAKSPQISIHLKRRQAINEMTRQRYDQIERNEKQNGTK